ncbi:MAG: DUF3299 domain-containing protein [Planctomycetes bacterium]|nr:DUF3299 domain-containing protein [Planctomycetota bacterium]
MRAHPLGALLLGFVLASCGSEEVPQGPRELPDAAPLDQAPPLRGSEPSLSPDLGSEPPLRADTVGGGEGSVRGLIEQAGLDEELASSLEALDTAAGDENANVVTFARLSLARSDYGLLLDHLYPDPAREGELEAFTFPEKVQALDGQEIELLGYMIPTEYIDTQVREFMLVRDTGACCYGGIPRPDEWALVAVEPEEGFEYFPYLPIVVKGKLTLLQPGSDPDLPLVYSMTGSSVRRYY